MKTNTLSLSALLFLCVAQTGKADLISAGNVLIDVNLATEPVGSTPASLMNTGTVAGDFILVNQAGQPAPAVVELTSGATTLRGIHLNKEQQYQNVYKGPATPAGLTAPSASRSIEVWGHNAEQEHAEEMMVGWGRRGGGDGTNMSFGWTDQGAFGAVGHWGGGPDAPWGVGGAGRPPLGEWRHLVYTYDGSDTRLYDNGALVYTETSGALDTHDGFPFVIGGQNTATDVTVNGFGGAGGGNFRGVISRVRIHDGVLDDAGVLNNFTEGPLSGVLDTDGDGVSDVIEDQHACMDKMVADATVDHDLDGLPTNVELGIGTDPCDADSDDDTINDGAEVNRMDGDQPAPTNPRNPDTDGDGLTDNVETDTGVNNGPSDRGTDPLVADGDGDGRSDGEEFESPVTDPFDPDSDNDGFDDGLEVRKGSDPNNPASRPTIGPLVEAGEVLIDVNVGDLDVGSTPATLPNTGTVVGDFELVNEAGQPAPAVVEITSGTTTLRGIHLNKEQQYQNVYKGPATPAGLTAPSASRSIEVWGHNAEQEHAEEMMVGWGRRGGGDGTNMSFGWTDQGAFGAVGHWGGGPDAPWGVGGAGRPPLGEWRHLVYTYDGSDTRLYDNGALVYTETSGALDTHDGFPFVIGGQNTATDVTVNGFGGAGGGNFRGVISRVRIHDGVLDAAGVLSNFETGPDSGPAIAFKITSISRDPATEFITLEWTSRSGRFYKVENSPDMRSWLEIDDNVAAGPAGTTTFTDTTGNPPGSGVRYYRVSQNPPQQP